MNGKKCLRGKGEFDYDYMHDVIFFKTRNREYEKSIEMDNIVLDIDDKNFITGIQIFEASKYFMIPKKYLRIAVKWKFHASFEKISGNSMKIEVRLVFQTKIRNKIIQQNPIITQNIEGSMPESEMICVEA